MENFNNQLEQFNLEKPLPHNLLAERTILSTLLVSTDALELALRNLKIKTFYFKNHQEIYKSIIQMYKDNIPIDILTLNSYLQDNGQLEKIGGIQFLTDLMTQIPNLVYLDDYIQLVQDKFIRRSLIKLGYAAINSAYITNIPLDQILNDVETELFTLTNRINPKNVSSNAELFANIFSELKQKSLNPTLPGISSGFYNLDSITQGFQKSDLIIVAGRPSMGKTALCLNFTLNILKSTKLPVLFFSLEMSKEQLVYRLLSSETNITGFRLKAGNLQKKEWFSLNTAIQTLSNLPLFIDDTPNPSIQAIRSKIKNILFEQNQIGLIIIDYLQLMHQQRGIYKDESRVQELSQITRSLKNIAREFKVPVIALSQLSRNVETRINKRPILSDLRESGSIEQDADLVLMLYRDNYYNLQAKADVNTVDLTELIITKQRNGPLGVVELEFDSKYTKFLNILST